MMASNAKTLASCIFCKIVKGEIPSFKLVETDLSLSFLDVGPLSKGHALIIPKYHAAKLHELPDLYLADALPIAKKIAIALGVENYNVLQNNGRIAHQLVDHVHFHVIPKPSDGETEGLVVGWPAQEVSKEELAKLHEEIKNKL
ncbi:HIT-like protein [Auriscalpium vulgare]|uniref:HIT-like protein n=1 Tax=Auriscalpium vulgare TaxID=40419 RepID=A0ACB8S0S1_9AGAM|nr:HIT-like protein [Auriscalpium vulgare]